MCGPPLALQRGDAYVRPPTGLGYPRRIVIIVLLCTDVGADILRRHQSDLMPLRSEETADVMRSAARLHSNRARWELACKFGKGRPSHASAQDDPSLHIQANNAVQVLAQVDSKGHDGHWLAPSSQTHQQIGRAHV